MKLGLYMFAEYIHMFVSSALMATLYFGGYNFPFMYDLGLSQNWITIIGVVVFFAKIFAFIFFLHVDPVDTPALSLRSIDEPGLEGIDPVSHCQHRTDRGDYDYQRYIFLTILGWGKRYAVFK